MILIIIIIVIVLWYSCNQENYMNLLPEYFVRRNSSYDLRGEAYAQPKITLPFNNSEIKRDNLMYRHKDGDY